MPRDDMTAEQFPSSAHDIGYAPKQPADWDDPDPRTIGQALDRVAESGGGGTAVPVVLLAAGSAVTF